jgi:hypothetical protein
VCYGFLPTDFIKLTECVAQLCVHTRPYMPFETFLPDGSTYHHHMYTCGGWPDLLRKLFTAWRQGRAAGCCNTLLIPGPLAARALLAAGPSPARQACRLPAPRVAATAARPPGSTAGQPADAHAVCCCPCADMWALGITILEYVLGWKVPDLLALEADRKLPDLQDPTMLQVRAARCLPAHALSAPTHAQHPPAGQAPTRGDAPA